ncbi:MAG: hypothetical protein RLZ10_3127 [Bacteroidota bacterium]|jgi:hypothetical protein
MKQYLTEEGWYGLVGLLYDEELYMAEFNDQFDRVFNLDFIKSLKGLKANYQDDIDVVNGGFVITVSRDYNRIDQFTGDTLFYDGGAAISLMFTPYKTGYRLTSVEPTGGGFY